MVLINETYNNTKSINMKPYYQDNNVVIYHANNTEILYELDKTDLCLTSPPYNLGDTHHNKNTRHNPYPDDLPEDEYQRQQVELLEALYANCECVLYNHKNRIKNGFEISPRDWISRSSWGIKQTLVWVNGGPNHDPIRFFPKTERVYWLANDSSRLANNKEYTDVLKFSPDANKLGDGHNRTFPLSLASCLLGAFPWAKTIIDPYAGSGTTLRAAKDMGLHAIGIEREEKYCEIAANRMAQECFSF
jgi:site-specific DNA-methyltransferase (adenine-specific)